jgi:prepilin-type N-terminal cleavage/methylation domain-containing protein
MIKKYLYTLLKEVRKLKIKDLKNNFPGDGGGFTLVELLIVIALIGVLATALVATLDPIEQINKARDSRFKNDAAELLAAIERYYASTQNYPWVADTTLEDVCGNGTEECTNNAAFGATAEQDGVGVCDDGSCDTPDVLIDSGELKSSFAKKTQFTTSDAIDKLYVRRTATGNSVYVCFIPKAGTNQESGTLTDVCTTGDSEGCTEFEDPAASCTDATEDSDWDSAGSACFICVPEVGSERVGPSS